MRSVNVFIPLVTSISYFTSFAQGDSTDYWISRINNHQLAFKRDYLGQSLAALSSGASKLIDVGKPATEKLLLQLTTEDKGIICHYILSKVYQTANPYSVEYLNKDRYRYNGLVFSSLKTNFISDRTDLIKRKEDWIEFLKTR